MISFQQFTLENGLEVYVHQDKTTPLAVMNILYNVGSRDESEDKTGFAHLFEHLMFGGSKHIKSYDEPLQKAGGENNAFTSTDITNYYISLPASNLETAFWLESDRMMSLSFDPQVLEVQRNVVIEEFKQRYLNQPYGDVWLKLRPLAYQAHPYKWPTIGKEISHIEDATMQDVKDFFNKHYLPNNANMVVAGNVDVDQVKKLAEKWFGPIKPGVKPIRNISREPEQKGKRVLEIEADVPLNAIYKVFHMPGRIADDYYKADLLSDVLGRGKSSRMYNTLVKDKKTFNSVQTYVTGSLDPGLLVVQGKLNKGVSMEEAEHQIDEVIAGVTNALVDEIELQKVKNQSEASLVFGEVELLNRAMNLSYFANMGDAGLVNLEPMKIQAVTSNDIHTMAKQIFKPENSSVLYYKSNN